VNIPDNIIEDSAHVFRPEDLNIPSQRENERRAGEDDGKLSKITQFPTEDDDKFIHVNNFDTEETERRAAVHRPRTSGFEST